MKKSTKDLKVGGDGMYVILVYDIVGEGQGQKIWKRTFNICKKYLIHIQKSVFEGELSETQIKRMEIEIKKNIREDLDSVIIFKSRTDRWVDKEMWGAKEDLLSPFI